MADPQRPRPKLTFYSDEVPLPDEGPKEEIASPTSVPVAKGWRIAGALSRLAGNVSSGVVGAVPSILTTPAAAALGGGGEALAEYLEQPSGTPLSPKRIGTEAALAAVPLGKIYQEGKLALSVARGAGLQELGNLGRRKAETGSYLPNSKGELASDALSTVVGGLFGVHAGLRPNPVQSAVKPTLASIVSKAVDHKVAMPVDPNLPKPADIPVSDEHWKLGVLDANRAAAPRLAKPESRVLIRTEEPIVPKTAEALADARADTVKKTDPVVDIDKGIQQASKIAKVNRSINETGRRADAKLMTKEQAADLQNTRATQGGTDLPKIEAGVEKAQTTAQKMDNDSAAADVQIQMEQEADAARKAATATKAGGQEASNLNARDKYLAQVEKETNDETARVLAEREAKAQQDKINEALKTAQPGPKVVTQTAKGVGENNEPQTLKQSFSEELPEEDGGDSGGATPKAPEPKIFFSKTKAKAYADKMGGPSAIEVDKMSDGTYRARPKVAEPVKVAPQPVTDSPAGNFNSQVNDILDKSGVLAPDVSLPDAAIAPTKAAVPVRASALSKKGLPEIMEKTGVTAGTSEPGIVASPPRGAISANTQNHLLLDEKGLDPAAGNRWNFRKEFGKLKDPTGATSLRAMMGLGGGVVGAGVGAANDKEDPLTGAIGGGAIGAGLGYGIPAAAEAIGGLKIPAIMSRLPDIQRFNYLAEPNGLLANTFGASTGLGMTGAIEKILEGDPRGFQLLKKLHRIPKVWANKLGEAGEMLVDPRDHVTESLPYSRAQNNFDRFVSLPATSITAAHMGLQDLAGEAGFAPAEAAQMALANEPGAAIGPENEVSRYIRAFGQGLQDMKARNKILEAGQEVDVKQLIGNIVAPFTRTATNVAAATPMKVPGLGMLLKLGGAPESWRSTLSQQALGTAISGGAYTLGANVDPQTAKYIRKWVRNVSGQYGVVATAAFEAGQASQAGKSRSGALVKGAIEGMPMPTGEVLQDWGSFISNLMEGNVTVPRSAIPAFLKKDPLGLGLEDNGIVGNAKDDPLIPYSSKPILR